MWNTKVRQLEGVILIGMNLSQGLSHFYVDALIERFCFWYKIWIWFGRLAQYIMDNGDAKVGCFTYQNFCCVRSIPHTAWGSFTRWKHDNDQCQNLNNKSGWRNTCTTNAAYLLCILTWRSINNVNVQLLKVGCFTCQDFRGVSVQALLVAQFSYCVKVVESPGATGQHETRHSYTKCWKYTYTAMWPKGKRYPFNRLAALSKENIEGASSSLVVTSQVP